MRRWQFLLELFLHNALMAVLQYLSFFLGRSKRLPSMACRSFLPGSGLAKNRIVLVDVSGPFGLPSFILGHFFLLGVGLRLSIKWVRVVKFFDPTLTNALWTMVNNLFRENFYEKIKKKKFNILTIFSIFHKNSVKTFLKWIVNHFKAPMNC